MERADARSAEIRRPDGVIRLFQVSRNTIEPSKSIRARNLLTKDDVREALADELEPRRPKMARIVGAIFLPGVAERLAGTGACPDWPFVWPSGEPQGVGPSADAGEEMALDEAGEV